MIIKRTYIILTAVLALLSTDRLIAQNVVDTIGIVRLENAFLVQPDTLQFDVRVIRNTDYWDRWANGTFMLASSDATFTFDPNNHEIELVPGSTDLNTDAFTGVLPKTSYHITPRIFDNRLSITIVGPEAYEDAIFVPKDNTGIKIGTFRVYSDQGELMNDNIDWKMPQDYWQACAFKIEHDTIHPPNIPWGLKDDNYEMDDFNQTTTALYEKSKIFPQMILDYFHCQYEGSRKVSLAWKTKQEAYNKGFRIYRGYVPLLTGDKSAVKYDHLVASFDGGKPGDEQLIGLGTTRLEEGREYFYAFDTVPFRGEEYCYILTYVDFYGREHEIAYIDEDGIQHDRARCCVPIPHAVITRAHPLENPFSESTTVEYDLDDDVILSIMVYDVMGKLVEVLMDEQVVLRGKGHRITFDAPISKNASQGLYDMIFIALPLDDPNIEVSRATVKLQLIR